MMQLPRQKLPLVSKIQFPFFGSLILEGWLLDAAGQARRIGLYHPDHHPSAMPLIGGEAV